MLNICHTCSAYKGEMVCKNGFPIQSGDKPMCLKDDFKDLPFRMFFTESGYPLLYKEEIKNGCK